MNKVFQKNFQTSCPIYVHRNFIMILLGAGEGREEQKMANFQEISL